MERKVIVTISREYGSGGHSVGEKLAKKLNIPFYDKEIIERICFEAGINKDLYDELRSSIVREAHYFDVASTRFLNRTGALSELSLHERIYLVQKKVIEELAKDSCVLVGRCSSYILKDNQDVVKVFVQGNIEDKIHRAIYEYGDKEETISETLLKIDKQRSNYYNYFTNEVWGKSSNYDLVINTTKVELDHAADVIKTYVEGRV